MSRLLVELCALGVCLGGAQSSETCPAGSDGCKGLVSLKCSGWRQTGGCNPKGKREPHGDKPCSAMIEKGTSGFCECEGGQRARESDCDHRKFSCESACLEFERFTCISWRQTGGCSADGAREPDNDKDCGAMIAPGSSGFCECGGERKVKRPGCDKAQDSEDFSCRDLCAREPDFYEELDLDFSASEKEIKGAFRKMSLKYHPDKTRNNPALAPRFSAIREAYDVLSNSEHRAVYDLGGYRMLVEAQQGKLQKGPAMEGSMEVDLENLYNGWETQTSISRKVICRGCREVQTTRCMQTCNAGCANELQNVNVQMGPFVVQQQQEVASKERCRIQPTNLWVQIERGMAGGDTMNFPGTGEQKPKMMPGDVTLKFKQRPHKVFTRTGNDLKMEIEINLKEALLGFERTIPHLDGHTVQLTINGVTRPHEVVRIRKEGMPYRGDPTSFGDLYIKCVLKMPSYESLLDHHRQWLSQNLPD